MSAVSLRTRPHGPLALLLCIATAAAGAGCLFSTGTPAAQAGEAVSKGLKGRKMLVYVGTYTQRGSKGIYQLEMDTETGALSSPTLAAETNSPSFLAIHPSRRFLYAANETTEYKGAKSGFLTSFAIDQSTGGLTRLNEQSSRGGAPCHLVVDKTGKNLLVANYVGGNFACLPIGADGKLSEASSVIQHTGTGPDKSRQEAPHGHSINLDAANRFAFAADLGLDKVFIYRFDPVKGTLTANDPPAGVVDPKSGPRHFAFHPNGRFAYAISEMASTVTMFHYDANKGALDRIQAIKTLPADFKGNSSTAEVLVHPSGKFLYGSNRGHDSIAIFTIDEKTGLLKAAGHQPTGGKTPRNFGIDPTGKFLLAANQDSDSIHVFRVNMDTGQLTPTGSSVKVPMPVCVKFLSLQ